MSDQLLFSESQLLSILSLSKDATAIYVTEELIIQYANDAMLAFWGKGRDIIGQTFEEAIPELNGQCFAAQLKEVMRTGITKTGDAVPAETLIDGKLQSKYYRYEYKAIKDENGETYCILHTAEDVSREVFGELAMMRSLEHQEALERERALNEELSASNEELNVLNEEFRLTQEELTRLNNELEQRVAARTRELSESEERFRAMAEGSGILIAVSDETKNGIYFNTAWSNLTGRSVDDFLGFGWADLIHPEDRNRYLEAYLSAFKTKAYFTDEFRILNRNGDYRWLLANGTPRFLPDGTFAGYISSCMDITSLKEAEQRKDDFISIASHELKTPLTSLKASLQLMLREKDTASSQLLSKLIEQANRSMAKITGLVEDLLNSSQIKEGRLHINRSTFVIGDLLNGCCNHIKLFGSHELIFQGDQTLQVYADEHRIEQVVVNLVNNAVKYASKNKKIYISVEKQENFIKIAVRDEGPGVDPEKIARLFDRYYRVDYTDTHYSGLGLGLYISAEIVKQHGGQIGAESELGKGSVFWFTLPLS
jgi:two-component system, OmpR family, sensor histidine kinase VicK